MCRYNFWPTMFEKNNLLFIIYPLLLCCQTVQKGDAIFVGVGNILEIIEIGKSVVEVMEHARNNEEKTEMKLFEYLGIINSKLDKLNQQIDAVGTNTISMVQKIVELQLRLNELSDYVNRMNNYYRDYDNYVKNRLAFEVYTVEDFSTKAISSESGSVRTLLERIHALVWTGNDIDSGLMIKLSGALKEVGGDMFCHAKQSPQQVLYNLYNTIAITELKGHIMIQFSYMFHRQYKKGNFTGEEQVMIDRYEERTNKAIEVMRKVMTNASRQLWNCDPKKHVKGETYEEITQLLQGFVQNEVDLNSEGTCRGNCAEYTFTKSYDCFDNLYCRQQRRCNGKIINCQYIDADMSICPANPLSGRRYEYIEYDNGRVFGRKQRCRRGSTKADSWTRWLFWQCSYCFCLCDEQGSHSDRYVNMRPSIADTDNNMIVTGLRFVKKNRIIHLQIQEGKLMERGRVDISTVHWVPVEGYKITDRKIYNHQDYHTFTWENRALDLDDLEAGPGYILTGIRFKEIGSHLNLEIYVTEFDFDTGKLVNPRSTSVWKDNPNTDSSNSNPRTKVHLNQPDIPIRSPSPSVPDSWSDQYIEFTNTDLNRDAGQTTVPFLDAQKLESLQAVPLSGAGLFHKGGPFSGGFITPKLITYDFSKHLKAVDSRIRKC
ncbi:unnamed protein product [Phaedon cochleariae]|uniref:Uncharacterized protein n=1 Tax=Phaedon cochleariae TaxID=80249 RepID=A0A9N9SAG2_PHACE|nr:unnamed protein product [Phaedon cochleariae]